MQVHRQRREGGANVDEIVNAMGFVLIALTWFTLRDMPGDVRRRRVRRQR